MDTKTTLHALGEDALGMIENTRFYATEVCDSKESLLRLATSVGVDIEPTINEDAARFILLANLVVMEKNTITFFHLG